MYNIKLDLTNKESKKRKGEQYLNLRVHNGTDQRQFSTKLTCKPEEFNPDTRRISNKDKQQLIDRMIRDLETVIYELNKQNIPFNAQDIIRHYKSGDFKSDKPFAPQDLSEMKWGYHTSMQSRIKKLETEVETLKSTIRLLRGSDDSSIDLYFRRGFKDYQKEISSYASDSVQKKFSTAYKNIDEYMSSDKKWSEIDEKFLFDFTNHLISKGLKKDSISQIFIQIRKFNDHVIRSFKYENKAVSEFKPDLQRASKSEMIKDILNVDQFDKIKNYKFSKPYHQQHLNFFLMIYALGSIRGGDVRVMKFNQFNDDLIQIRASKTGKLQTVDMTLLSEERLAIVEDVLTYQKQFEDKEGYVFPALQVKGWTSNVNRVVKMLQNAFKFKNDDGDPIEISMNTARHSFALKCVLEGYSLVQLKILFGHESIATTEKYLKSLKKREIQRMLLNMNRQDPI